LEFQSEILPVYLVIHIYT